MKKNTCALIVCISIILNVSSCANSKNNYYEKSNIVMDTVVTLSAYGENSKEAVEESFEKLDKINEMASISIDTSDVAKINSASGKSYVKVHPEIFRIIETSIEYSKLSDGAFDITIGPIINLWGIGTDNERVPSDEEIKAKLSLVGYEKISLNKGDNGVMLQKEGMAIDLGGITKGFAVDEVLKIYKRYNIENGLINLGASSIYALGKNKNNNEWSVGIKHPRSEDPNEYMGIIKLSNESLSTSGDYERYFMKNHKRYHHIINPKTGYPVDNGVISDTIVIEDNVPNNGMISDVLTTTVFALGPEKGLKLIDSLPDVSCEITTSDYKVYASMEFKDGNIDLNKEFTFSK